jgi:hypothetical protein
MNHYYGIETCVIEAQRKLVRLATGYRPPFDPDRILDERFEAIRREIIHRPNYINKGWTVDGDHFVFHGTIHIAELAPDETAYVVLEPAGDLAFGLPRGNPS